MPTSEGIILPFALGFGIVVLAPRLWSIPREDQGIFALFMGIVLSISALPIIARILIDIDLLKTEVGGIIMGAPTINDMVGWVYFRSDSQQFEDEHLALV